MTPPCLLVAWIGFALGILSGALIGLGFHGEEWLGGYGSWRRRLIRLGHIACFGLGLLCLAWHLSAPVGTLALVGGWGLILSLATMPTVCWLSAWRQPCRKLFPIPVAAATIGVACTLGSLCASA